MKRRGLTLLELMIALAMLAIVASLALPSFGATAERARLKNSAETLAADIAEARFEAAQRGQPLYISFQGGSSWCWSVATAPGCPCAGAGNNPPACELKHVNAADNPGIELLQPQDIRLEPGGALAGSSGFSAASLQSRRGERLRVQVSALGRASICVAAGEVRGYGGC